MAQPQTSLYKPGEPEGLFPESRFRFRCHAGLSCFNRCCHAPTIVLSPYDILRLKEFLGITSGEFLARYTLRVAEESSGFPLVFMDAFRSPQGGCPFLGAGGCTVYQVRPAACRLFPITMGSELTAQGVVDHFFCRRLDYCQGFDCEEEWTVASWMACQGFDQYHRERRPWLEILLRQRQKGPLTDNDRLLSLGATLAYDLDKLRGLLTDPAFRRDYALEGRVWEEFQGGDGVLLTFSYRFLRHILLGERGEDNHAHV
jgi:hypothetical protein